MNCIARTIPLVVGLIIMHQTAVAQRGPARPVDKSPAVVAQTNAGFGRNICKEAKGTLFEFWGGGNDSPGTIRNGGWLNGVTLVVFNSSGFPTPVPTAFSYTGIFTITTARGQLKGTRLFITDNGSGWSSDMTVIDPKASTGIFAGATGVVYVTQNVSNASPPPTTYESEVRALICFTASTAP